MESLIGFLAVVFVFGLIVAIHEWGHMVAAKLCGVAVPDFALGMGPSLVSREWRGTRYHICLLPLGGFVRIEGLEPEGSLEESSSRTKDGLFVAKGKSWRDANSWQQAFMLVAGPLMNIVLAFVILLLMGFTGFPVSKVRVVSLLPGYPAEAAGFMAGDVIDSVAGQKIERSSQVAQLIQAGQGAPVDLVLIRAGQEIHISPTPRALPKDQGGKLGLGFTMKDAQLTNVINLIETKKVGNRLKPTAASPLQKPGLKAGDKLLSINGESVSDGLDLYFMLPPGALDPVASAAVEEQYDQPIEIGIERDGQVLGFIIPAGTDMLGLGVGFSPMLQKLPPGQSFKRAFSDGMAMMYGMYMGLKMMYTARDGASIGGPVTIANIIAQSTKTGAYTFLLIMFLININLALLNLLPFPALDGGRLGFVFLNAMLEFFFRWRIPQRIEAMVHSAGMAVLLGLIVLVSVYDVIGALRL